MKILISPSYRKVDVVMLVPVIYEPATQRMRQSQTLYGKSEEWDQEVLINIIEALLLDLRFIGRRFRWR
jgi:hypothetical protein